MIAREMLSSSERPAGEPSPGSPPRWSVSSRRGSVGFAAMVAPDSIPSNDRPEADREYWERITDLATD